MPGFFPDDWLNDLRSRTDIVDVVSEYVPLKPKGSNYWGLCPFHNEKTPSFSVNPDKGMYYCFGCHVGGNAIHFIMNIEKLSFYESVKLLADKAGMPMQNETDIDSYKIQKELRDRLYDVNKEAARYFHEKLYLPEGQAALSYLHRRHLSDETIKRFGLGFAPQNGEAFLNHLKEKGFKDKDITDAGLALIKGTGNIAAFRGRVIFPIINTFRNVAGFGARALDDAQPKYINTAETPVFNKRRLLYGLNNVKKGATLKSLVIVEGYMDAISLYQHGIRNAVASLGTALSNEQARLMGRYSSNIFIAYDGDSAGQQATIRGLDILKSEGLDVKVIQFPDEMDPDEFINHAGMDGFEKALKNSLTLTEFKLKTLARNYDLDSEDERTKFAIEGVHLVAAAGNAVERERYLQYLNKLTKYSSGALKEQLDAELKSSSRTPEYIGGKYRNTKPENSKAEARSRTEKTLLCAMAMGNRYAMMGLNLLKPEELVVPEHRAIASMMEELVNQDKTISPYSILSCITEEDTAGRAAGILADEVNEEDAEKTIKDCVSRILVEEIEKEMSNIQQTISKGEDHKELNERLKVLVNTKINLERR